MKKEVTTFSEIRESLKALDQELGLSRRLEGHDLAVGLDAGGELGLAEPTEAPSAGRGRREKSEVFFLNYEELGGEAGVQAIVSQLRALKGIEEVGTPELDTQLGAVWGIPIIYRISQ